MSALTPTLFSRQNRQAWVKTEKPRRHKMSFSPDSDISPLKIIFLSGAKGSGFESPKRRFSPSSPFFQSPVVIRIQGGPFCGRSLSRLDCACKKDRKLRLSL
ncbi:hypothetical protein CEXT_329331 [Caerostris extrusa]|uniref:Uncharacterized protein n=1 Tax=Caerostris extrusa TaxID=172846 RepID=A0AAV4Y8T0_CAEEX|nr:hypothetical protein CEXT_329331 [Caerostris extrusa]